MLVSYKGRLITSIIIIFLDGLIVYLKEYYFNNLDLFYPMLTISLLPFLLKDNLKEYYKLCFIIGVIYDLCYSNIVLFHALVFLLLGKINGKIMKYWKNNLFLYLFLVLLNIFLYDSISFLLVKITSYQVVSVTDLFYKLKNSILLNILSSFIYFILARKTLIKHKM